MLPPKGLTESLYSENERCVITELISKAEVEYGHSTGVLIKQGFYFHQNGRYSLCWRNYSGAQLSLEKIRRKNQSAY
ncbi:hypothetical protein CDAR_109731 [Caerostris darwini]|uniref:Uncharacterized protein n=1 Tax=Caerostris darwini TaxID=1538125 RepID=A0AAV4SXJ3_9ARAC|nr:hypothetical protein CDAR_109731 [Caerostris darwini]